jgi:hypothetical protein
MKHLPKNLLNVVLGLGVLLGPGVAWSQEMCTIQGTGGACSVSVNAVSSNIDGCGKYQEFKYIGVCRNGLLEGVVLLNQSSVFNGAPYFSKQLSSFNAGVVDDPSTTYGKDSIGFTDRASGNGSCFFWSPSETIDARRRKPFCVQAAEKYVEDVMDKAFWEKVFNNRIGVSQLPKLRAVGAAALPNQSASARDDPKVRGRSARGG